MRFLSSIVKELIMTSTQQSCNICFIKRINDPWKMKSPNSKT